MIEQIVEKIQQRLDKHGERIAILEDTTTKNSEISAMRHAKLELAVENVINLHKETNHKLEQSNQKIEALIIDIKEPIEDFKIRKMGMIYVKSFIGNLKHWAVMAIGAFGVLALMNLTTIFKLFDFFK